MRDYILFPICKFFDFFLASRISFGVPVLVYHSINDNDSKLCVAPDEFERQVSYLRRKGYSTINPREIARFSNQERKILLTFDDGFRDNVLNALPILKKYGFVASIFVSTDYIGKKSIHCRQESEKNFDMVDTRDIKVLEKDGWSICNHFASHRNLDQLSEIEIEAEAEKSVQALEKIIEDKKTAKIFSYPHSKFNDRVIKLMKKIAEMAFNGKNMIDNRNLFFISRIDIAGYVKFIKFKCLLSPTYLYLRQKK